MKKAFFLLLLFACVHVYGQHKPTILLSGASFATPANGWFEFGCEDLGAVPINRSVGGESIIHTATKMHEGTLYTKEEFEDIDVLVIMHVHNRDVYAPALTRNSIEEYSFPMDKNAYAEAYDYVIKKYTTDCYNLKDDPESRYYGTRSGKPAVIILCTHWHDSRVRFNTSVRLLAASWGLPVVEFDRNIGFTYKTLHPVTGEQYSRIFAKDTQEADGEIFGWHPMHGDNYIQRRMAAIFVKTLKEVFPF